MLKTAAILFVLAVSPMAAAQVADGYLETWLANRTQQLDARLSQRAFDSIGWSSTIQQALELASEHHRPVLLFTLDGHMGSGRC